MTKVLFDCDNTLGLRDRDVDDALALLYLLGSDGVQVCGVTTSFGNDGQEAVFGCTRQLMEDWGLGDVPLHRGAESMYERESPARRFLCSRLSAETKEKEKPALLATGCLSNLSAVHQADPRALPRAGKIVLMGGIVEPLRLNASTVGELNFAVDPEAAYDILESGLPITVVTGNLCLQALLDDRRLQDLTKDGGLSIIREPVLGWNSYFGGKYGIPGFYVWDVVAAVYLTHPQLFQKRRCILRSRLSDLKRGYLDLEDDVDGPLNVPRRILDVDAFWKVVEMGWARGALRRGSRGRPTRGRPTRGRKVEP